MLGVLAAPSALFFVLLLPTPESPRWLIGRGRTDEARAVLVRLGVDRNGVDQEVAEIRASIDPEHPMNTAVDQTPVNLIAPVLGGITPYLQVNGASTASSAFAGGIGTKMIEAAVTSTISSRINRAAASRTMAAGPR